ncbi:MAG TPA: hypothetical protein VFS24_19225, partial [Steroidobacteraceae bacterium]|nr:hypothetical protein [Steroidobacteraceae bacterium]
VQLAPSIIDVSRELLKLSKKAPADPPLVANTLESESELAQRVVALEQNERRQAELLNQMAQQLDVLSQAVTVLHKRMLWLGGTVITLVIALAIVASMK